MNKEINQIKDDIKSRLSIVELISETVHLEPAGKDYKGLCPFHKEKTPSFFVSERKGKYNCFGCGERGDIFSFLMQKENLQFYQVLRRLSEEAGVELPSYGGDDIPRQPEFNDFSINEIAANYFHQKFIYGDSDSNHWKMVHDRKINIETIKEFNLGFCPNNDIKGLKEQYDRQSHIINAKKIGLIKESKTGDYCLFNNRLIFPIKNHYGIVAGFAGRTLVEHDIKYLNSPASVVYAKHSILYGFFEHKDDIRRSERVILVEGYTDLLRLHQEGIKNVVAMCGTAFTSEQAHAISNITKSITFLFDGDSAGIKSAISKSKIALAYGLKLDIALLPDNHDPDSYVIEHGVDALNDILGQSKDPFTFCAEYLTKNNPDKLGEIELSESIALTLIEIIVEFPKAQNQILFRIYLNKIDVLTGLGLETIEEEYKRIKSEQRVPIDDNVAVIPTPSEEENTEIEGIISKNNLLLAWSKINRFAQTHDVYYDSREFDDFSQKEDAYIELLHHQLKELIDKDETWVPEPFRMLKIKKQNGEFRELVIPSKIQDRIVIQAVFNIIAPEIEKKMSPNSFGHRISKNFSTSDEIFTPWPELYGDYHKKLRSFLDSPEEYYYLKADIESFYANIQVAEVIDKVQPFVKSAWSINIISNYLNYQIYEENGGIVSQSIQGLPQGPAYGHLLANVFLNDFDTFIENEIAITNFGKTTKELFEESEDTTHKIDRILYRYSRYVDDIYILFDSEEEAIAGRQKIEEKLNPLQLKDEKTDIVSVTDTSHIIDEIKKKKYDLGKFFDFEETLTGDQKDMLYKLTENYLHVSNQESLLDLNQNINQIVHNLKGTEYFDENEDDLTNLVIELIFSESFKYSSADSLFKKMLPSIFSENHETKFLSHLKDADAFKVLLVLQAIGRHGFYNDLSETFQKFIFTLLDHDNYYVRIGASDCLSNSEQILITNILKSKIDQDQNIEVKKALLYLTPLSDTSAIRIYTQGLMQSEPKLQKRIVQVLSKRDTSFAVYILKQIDEFDKDATVNILQIILSHPTSDSIQLLNRLNNTNIDTPIVLENLLDDVLIDYYIDSTACLDLIDNLKHIENETILMIMQDRVLATAIEKALGNEGNQSIIDKLNKASLEIDKRTLVQYHELFEIAGDRKNYKAERISFLDSQGIRHRAFRCEEDDSIISFEIIDEYIIPEGKTLEQYRKELKQLKNRNIIYFESASIVNGENGSKQLIIKYEFKSTWNLMAEKIRQDSFTEKTMAGIIFDIQNKYQQQFGVGYPSPFTIALNSFNDAVFVHVGATLSTPRYTSHTYKSKKNDTNTFDSLFLGWLSFEMLTQSCPITEQVELKKDDKIDADKKYLSNSPKLLERSLPYTRFLKRMTYDNASYRKLLMLSSSKIDIKNYRTQLDETRKVFDGFGDGIATKYSFLEYISTRIGDHLRRSGINKKDIGGSVQYTIKTLMSELIQLEKTRGIDYFYGFEGELLSEKHFHLGSQQLLKFNKRFEKVQSEINGFVVNYKPNLLFIYLVLRIELLAIAYRFVTSFKDIWESEYAQYTKKDKKRKLFLKFVQNIDSELDKVWWVSSMNKYSSDITALLDEKQTQDYLINSSLSGIILFIAMAQSDKDSFKMKKDLLNIVEFEMCIYKHFRTMKMVSKDKYVENVELMKDIVISLKSKFRVDRELFKFVNGCVFHQLKDVELTNEDSSQNVSISKIVFPTTDIFEKTRLEGESISCDLVDGIIVSTVPVINQLHNLSVLETVSETRIEESAVSRGEPIEIKSFDFVIYDDRIDINVNDNYPIPFNAKMIGRHNNILNKAYQYLLLIAPNNQKGNSNIGSSKSMIERNGMDFTQIDKVRSEINTQIKKIINRYQLLVKAEEILIPTSGGSSHLLGVKCSIQDERTTTK